jgi:hypothetical protein
MIYQLLEWGCMVGGFAAFFYRLPALLRDRSNPALLALCVYFLCSAMSFLLGLDAIWPYIANLFGYENVTTILIHTIVVVLTAAQQVVLVYWTWPPEQARPRARRRLITFGSTLVILVFLFFFALPSRRHGAETASLLNVSNPSYALYLFCYTTVVAAGQVETVRLSLRYAKMVGRSWLRIGMLIVTAGAILILVYCGMRDAEVIGVHAGFDMAPWDPVQWTAGDVGSLFEIIGWTLPGWGPRLSAGERWVRDYRTYRRLRPLWAALYEAVPAIALDPPRTRLGDLLPLRDLDHRLYRRVIEIRDAQLALRPYTDPAAAEAARERARAAGFVGDWQHAMVEASVIGSALYAKAHGLPAHGGSPITTAPEDGDIHAEISWLSQVADAFVHHFPKTQITANESR